MLSSPVDNSTLERFAADPAQNQLLPEEREFYQSYDWCLNPYLTIAETIIRLNEEVDKLSGLQKNWQVAEVAINIFLLSSGIFNCIEEYLRGSALRLPSSLARTAIGRCVSCFLDIVFNKPWLRHDLVRWREQWLAALNDFLSIIVGPSPNDANSLAKASHKLTVLLRSAVLSSIQKQRLGVSTPFSRLDLTQNDFVALGNEFMRRFGDRDQPILLLGLRSSGSYVGPLLRALFQLAGYHKIALLTIEPNKGVGRRENKELRRFAAQGYWALILDDPPHTGVTVLAALDIANRVGFKPCSVKILAPTHPASTDWFKALPAAAVVTLPPEQWQKRELLNPRTAELVLTEYFRAQQFACVSIVTNSRVEQLNVHLHNVVADKRSARLKRIFELKLERCDGNTETRFVLAKSVGWGWLGYHAFLTGQRLYGYVPPILGLRDGILYMEWIAQSDAAVAADRKNLIETSARYVAARVRYLGLSGLAAGMDLRKYDNGSRVLERVLSRAYGTFLTDRMMRARVGKLLRERVCPSPTVIDGNMRLDEWIFTGKNLLKTDFEHHGMGKTALNVVDPAYDLADIILNLSLSAEEERDLITHYVAKSGDCAAAQRLFLHKLLAGLWAMSRAQDQLFNAPLGRNAQHFYHRQFMNAWNFLTVQVARRCGELLPPPRDLRLRSPLVVLDVDGVLDRRFLGFPCTTASGIAALSVLNAHQFSVALNTARSAVEVKDYCKAYSFVGGIAEYGAYLWDAVHQRDRVLISSEAMRQLDEMRTHLQNIPGVFLDDRHRYSIRAFTYCQSPAGLIPSLLKSIRSSSIGDGAVAPISPHIVNELLVDRGLDRLTFHQTMIDTTIVIKDVNKGTGLIALRDWILTPDAETIAVGDGAPDLEAFRAATRSFAPSHIHCRNYAQLYGCNVVVAPYQRGLLEIARKIVHPDNSRCDRCSAADAVTEAATKRSEDIFLEALYAADEKWRVNLFRALRQHTAYKFLIQ